MNFEKYIGNKTVQLFIVALIAIAYIQSPQAVLQNDLDSAVRWASDYLFRLGNNSLILYPHTNGPLFFLKFPAPIGYSILLSVLFDVLLKFLLGWYMIKLSNYFRPKNFWLPLVVFVAFCTFLSFDFIIIAIVLGSCLFTLNSKKPFFIIPGIIILLLSIFIKASISFPSLFIFGSTMLLLVGQKRYSVALKLSAIFFTLFITLTIVLYGINLNGFSWIANSFIKTLGYGSDQAIPFNNFLPYMVLTVLFIALPVFLIKNKQSRSLFFITALAIFAVWKYCLGREDFTHYHAWYLLCITLAGFIVVINRKQAALIGAICYFLSFGFFITNTKRGDSPKEIAYHTPRFDYLPRVLLKNDKVIKEYQNHSNEYLKNSILSDSILNLIGDQTIDVFPWGLTVLYKYNLNYKARPNFHSTLLGSKADYTEGNYFAAKDAPTFVLWHNSQPALFALNAHDQIYLPNSCPGAIASIVKNYKLLRYENGFALWQKEKSGGLSLSKGEWDKKIMFNEWFAAPAFDSSRAIYGSTNFILSTYDKIRSFLYKGRFFRIVYKLKNGQEAAHFISLESLQKNFILQPYFTNPSMEYQEIEAIKLEPLASKFNNKAMQLNWRNSFWISD